MIFKIDLKSVLYFSSNPRITITMASQVAPTTTPVPVPVPAQEINKFICGAGLIGKLMKPPPNTDIRTLSLTEAYDKINKIVIDSYFTSMRIGFCSFTNKIYDEDDIFCRLLRGCANTHRLPGGWIQVSSEAEHFIECCSMIHNIMNKLFPVGFTDLPEYVKVPRSSKSKDDQILLSDGNITKNSAIWRSKSRDCLHIKVQFGEPQERFEKSVSLKTLMYVNNIKSISLNPRVYGEEYISQQPENTQRIFAFFNQKYRDFLAEKIIPEFEKEKIPFTLEYKEFDFSEPAIY